MHFFSVYSFKSIHDSFDETVLSPGTIGMMKRQEIRTNDRRLIKYVIIQAENVACCYRSFELETFGNEYPCLHVLPGQEECLSKTIMFFAAAFYPLPAVLITYKFDFCR